MAMLSIDRRRLVVLAAGAALLVFGPATVVRADPILVSDLRFVSASVAQPFVTDIRQPETAFSPFTATASMFRIFTEGTVSSSAFETSSVTPTHITGSGVLQASAPCCGVYATANSALNIVFDLDRPYQYVFTGLLAPESGFAELVAAFGGERGFGERGALYDAGTLQPGRHEFIMEGYVEGPASARYNVDLKLSPVPEPGSLVLIGTGLLGFAWRRRQRRLSSSRSRNIGT